MPILLEVEAVMDEKVSIMNEKESLKSELILNAIDENVQSTLVENQDTLSDTVKTEPTLPK